MMNLNNNNSSCSCGTGNKNSAYCRPANFGLLLDDFFGIPLVTALRKHEPFEETGFRKNAAGVYFIHLEVPGMKAENLNIEQHEDAICIKGEVKIGEGDELYTKSIRERLVLPDDADPEQVSAKLTDGVLTIRVQPRTKSVPGTRRITIE